MYMKKSKEMTLDKYGSVCVCVFVVFVCFIFVSVVVLLGVFCCLFHGDVLRKVHIVSV